MTTENAPSGRSTTRGTAAPGETATAAVGIDPKVAASLKRYRVIAYTVGIGLIALCVAVVFKYAFGSPGGVTVIGPLHGFLYMIYIALAVDLALKARWSVKGAVLVLL
ncbi:MAG: DUF3817 domain-containing protein, partial [Sciscionella sp.]